MKQIIIFFSVVFLLIQFIRPEKNIGFSETETSFVAFVQPPDSIRLLLTNACYDCHSNNTKYPWYSNISPFSWYISSNIEKGKKRLNFSEWTKYSVEDRNEKSLSISKLVKRRWMPLQEYVAQHQEALLTNKEVAMLVDFFDNESK